MTLELLAHVDDRYGRQGSFRDSLSQLQVPDLARHGCAVEGFDRGSSRAEEQDAGRAANPMPGHLAGVVTRRLVLLVRGVVFFVEHDESDALERGKHSGASTDDDGRAARLD